MTEYVTDAEIYRRVILGAIPQARRYLWIGTSDLKDLYVAAGRAKMAPFLGTLSELAGRGVELRLAHAKEPGPNFRRDFDRYPDLVERLELMLCPRVHFKTVVVDGAFAYSGSANLTGAGMGAKGDGTRNFEAGFVTDDKTMVAQIIKQFDQLWLGAHCPACRRKRFCAEYQDILGNRGS
ncbi:MAG: phospholipase D family protein [Candidatus Edwardsbacteria bacterium]|jgi:phosphatidylserine/phosphatidylglycerophosphate/cardiolipin synthase-like enzyme|nr:phospholipase D family protein [Candidatus Edwardsbacteria bacterium]